MKFFKNILFKVIFSSVLLFGSSQSLQADDISDFTKSLIEILATTTQDITLKELNEGEDTTDHEIIIRATVTKIATSVANVLVEKVLKDATASSLQITIETALFKYYGPTKLANLGNTGQFGVDLLVGIIIDVTGKMVQQYYTDMGKPVTGEMAAYAISQLKVVWAARNGIHYAILEQASVSSAQLLHVVELHHQWIGILEDNAVNQAFNRANLVYIDLSSRYKTGKICDYYSVDTICKNNIESEVRALMRDALVVDGGYFSFDEQYVGTEEFINYKINALRASDARKYKVPYAYIDKIKSNPSTAQAYADAAKIFIDNNFYNDGTLSSSNEAESFKLLIDRALASIDYSTDELIIQETETNNEVLFATIYMPSSASFNTETKFIDTLLGTQLQVSFSPDYNERFPDNFNFKEESFIVWCENNNGERFFTPGAYDETINGLSFVTNMTEPFKLLKMGVPRIHYGKLKHDTVYFPNNQIAIAIQDTQQLIKNVTFVSETPVDDIVKTTEFTKVWNFGQDIEALGLSITVLSNSYSNSVTPSSFTINGKTVSINLIPNTSQNINSLVLEFRNQDNEVVTVSGYQNFWSKTISVKPVYMVVTCSSEIHMEENFVADIAYTSHDSDSKIIPVTISVEEAPSNGTIKFNNTQPYYEPNDGYSGADSFKLKFTYNDESEVVLVNATIHEYIPPVAKIVDGGGSGSIVDTSPNTSLSASYLQNDDTFQVNWDARNTDTLEILYSYNQTTWSRYGLFTLENYVGNTKIDLIVDSKSNNKVYFKAVSTKDGVSVTSNWLTLYYTTFEDSYVEKGTEVPNTPIFASLGNSTVNNYIQLYWQRINDSLNNDNVSYYEIMYADNSSFANATIVNAGNNAPGENIYESCSYTIQGLEDNKNYYFKIRAVNIIGTSSWSNYETILIELEDRPYFDNAIQFPANSSTGVSKIPTFQWKAFDDDGDNLEYYISYGESADNLVYNSGWIENGNDFFTFNTTLRPNTTYFWKVQVREDGYYSDHYGGTYIESNTWSFTTSSEGPDLSITSVELIGDIFPDSYAKFRLTVQNIGTEAVLSQFIRASYKKGTKVTTFRNGGSSLMPEDLAVNQSVTFDIDVRFHDEILYSGDVEYDNVLIVGDSQIIFYIDDEDDADLSNNTYTHEVGYENQGKPVFDYFYLSTSEAVYNGEYSWPIYDYIGGGDRSQVVFDVVDDMLVSKVTIEYRLNENDSWHLLKTYTNDHYRLSDTYEWAIPNDDSFITGSMQIKVKAYEDDTSFSEKISYPFPVFASITPEITEFSVDKTELTQDESLTFNWVSNGAANTLYTVFIKEADTTTGWEQIFSVQGVSSHTIQELNYPDGKYNVMVRSGSARVTYEYELTLGKQTIATPIINNANFALMNNTPTISFSFNSIENADTYVIARGLGGKYEEVSVITNTSFTDNTVIYGNIYTYMVTAKNSSMVSEPSIATLIKASYTDTYGINIITPNYQVLDTNSLILDYEPSVSADYEAYEIHLGTSTNDMQIYVRTQDRNFVFTDLKYATTYFVEIYPIDYNRVRLSSTSSKLTFTTGFDNRVISKMPVIAVEEVGSYSIALSWNWISGADEYYVCRSDNNSDYNCFTKVTTTSFLDTVGIQSSTSYKYKVVAVNANSNMVSEATPEIITGLDDATKVKKDTELLTFGLVKLNNLDEANIVTQLNLVTNMTYGSSVYWASSDYSILNSSTGTLNRSDSDTPIKLIATISYGDAIGIKVFDLIVKEIKDTDPNVNPLALAIVGKIKYFANSTSTIGYRNYIDDGTYIGSETLTDGTTLPVDGIYEITSNILTINRITPTSSTLVLTYLGEDAGVMSFTLSIDGGAEIKSYFYDTAQERDDYINKVNPALIMYLLN